jgi:hypothetical protein
MSEHKEQRLTKAALLRQAAEVGLKLRQLRPTKGDVIKDGATVCKSGPSPGSWAVTKNGKRIDSFLSEPRAIEKIRQLLGEGAEG